MIRMSVRLERRRMFAHVEALLAGRVLSLPPGRHVMPKVSLGWMAP